ncbi:hypothetical protein SxD43FB_15700 [Sphingobium sp. D43FB]|nr:hypothetical protein SxD43FB_15700 [Sphingobium sp. D43FB]
MGNASRWLATTFALEALAMNGRPDRIRFLNATSWFEAIPDIYMTSGSAIPRTDLDEAAGSAAAILAGQGHSDLGQRVRGLIGNFNTPSLGVRLQAALAWLRVRYGLAILPSNAEETCRLIPTIRGSYAHGDDPLLGRHAGSVLEAALLTEAVCHLLMLAGLGFDLCPDLGTDHVLTDNLTRLKRLALARAAANTSASA